MNESFDVRARTWDDEPIRVQRTLELFAVMEKVVPMHPHQAALDYGCGTGLLTLPLAGRVGRVTGVDTSEGMLEVLAQKAQAGGLGNIEPLRADFTADPLPPGAYDLITSAMALHHVADTQTLLQSLFQLLTSGGTLAVADLDTEDGSFHGGLEGIPHAGFDRDALSRQLANCGFEEIQFITASRMKKNNRVYPVFLVTAHKP